MVGKGGRAEVPLRPLPVEQLVGDGALTLKRGCTAMRFDGEHAPEIVGAVLELAAAGEMTEDELVACFSPEAQEPIRSLIGELRARRLLLPAKVVPDRGAETPLDVFFWHFGLPDEPWASPPRDTVVAVSGGNATAARLCALLEEAGFGEIVADAEPGALSDRVPAVVAAVSESGFGALSAWNDFSLEHDVPFLPVAIEDLVAYVGPLVVPHQTACFECFLRRRYSNLDEAEARRPVELRGGGTPVVGLHPGICAVAAGAAALELSKLFLPWHGVQQAGHLLTFNLLAGRSGRHRVLKLPRCPACSSLHARQPVAAASSRLSDDGV